MLAFRTTSGAGFSCAADFSTGSVLNLNFFDADRETIPFHLSVRRDENLIVINRFDAKGWRREIAFEVDLGFGALPIEVRFLKGRAEVWVDGKSYGLYDALPRPDPAGRMGLRRGFPGLRRIAYVDIGGQIVAGSLLIDSPDLVKKPLGKPVLNDALEVVLDGLTVDSQAELGAASLQVEGFAEPIAAILRALPYALPGDAMGRRAHVLAAVLPGRIWAEGATALDMDLRRGDGTSLGVIRVTREGLCQHIGRLAASGSLANDDRAALQAIEHTRHAGLLPLLNARQRAGVILTADRYGLTDYLLEGTENSAQQQAPLAALPADDDQRLLNATRDGFTQTMRHKPDTDPITLLQRLIPESGLSGDRLDALFLSFSEWFCIHDEMHGLARLRRAFGRPALPQPSSTDPYAASAMLPFYFAEGRFKEVVLALKALVAPTESWILTPAIGWVASQVAVSAPDIDGQYPSFGQRGAIIKLIQDWIAGRAPDYWERTQCLRLIQGMVALLSQASSLTQRERLELTWLLLQVYALSPSFWQEVAASQRQQSWALPVRLQKARDGFLALEAAMRSGPATTPEARADIHRQLGFFQHLGIVDFLRFRRDLLGPSGVPVAPGALPDPDQSLKAGVDPEEAVLRHLSFPRVETLPDEDAPILANAVRRGVERAYLRVPVGAFRTMQSDALANASALLRAPDKTGLDHLERQLVPLISAEARFLGLTLGLSLVKGLLMQDRGAEAMRLTQYCLTVSEATTEAWEHDILAKVFAPAQALWALQHAFPDHEVTARAVAGLAMRVMPQAAVPTEDRAADIAETANPLFDTVVCLYTCQANLQTRVAAIRESWMQALQDLGVRCLIFVGGGDGRRDGDVVYLDAPDDYEGLPQKTLAMVEWVQSHTRFGHLFKVDDDCFLDVDAFFGDLTYRKFDYYGRVLSRARGQMDRAWHMGKSHSARGRLELDKSPEPSTYCDGGSGYALSRRAMTALIQLARSAPGRELIQLSFMEDKLVGDLLNLRAIKPEGEDYRVCLLRRTKPGGPLVPAWDNGFLPFANSGIKLAHLDGYEQQASVMANSRKPWPSTFKIWPSYQPVQQCWCSNTLDLISSPEKLAQVNAAEVAVVACLRNEIFILQRFLDHYRAMGVTGFLIADNGSDDGSFEFLAAQPDVALFAVDTDYSASHYGVAWQQALISNFRTGRWSLVADADEFLFGSADRSDDLPEIVRAFDAEGATAARVFMLDMYPQASLSKADFAKADPFEQAGFVDREPFGAVWGGRGPFADSPVWTSALRHRLIPGSRSDLFVAQKYALLKYMPWMRLSAGLHFVANLDVAQRELFFGHFKYNAAFRAKAQAEVGRKQHYNDAEEYRKYLALVSEGRDVVYDPAVSVRWHEAKFVRDRLRP